MLGDLGLGIVVAVVGTYLSGGGSFAISLFLATKSFMDLLEKTNRFSIFVTMKTLLDPVPQIVKRRLYQDSIMKTFNILFMIWVKNAVSLCWKTICLGFPMQ